MTNKIISLTLISFMFLACSRTTNETKKNEPVVLKLNVKKDETYNMKYTMYVHNDTTGDETNFTIDLSHKIGNTSADKIEIISYFQNISMKANLKGNDVDLIAGDTAKAETEAALVAAPYFAFHKRTVTAEYTSLFKKIAEKIQNADTVKALVGVESKAQFIAQYPENEIGINDTWESDLAIKIGNQKIEKAIFIVKSISENEVILNVSGTIDGKGEKFGHEFSMKGNFTGEITIDKKTGWQNKSALHIQFVLDMMGNKTPMKQEITYSLK